MHNDVHCESLFSLHQACYYSCHSLGFRDTFFDLGGLLTLVMKTRRSGNYTGQTLQLPRLDSGLCDDLPQHSPHLCSAGAWGGGMGGEEWGVSILWTQGCRISMTQGINRIYRKSSSEGPASMVQQRPGTSNQIKDSF